jgi:TonB-dependent starch-binding outer membrane protein SusC
MNLGFESVLWKGLLSVNLDVFQSKRKNILTKKNASTPDYTGLTLPDVNIGTVENNGFEMELIHSKVVNNDFRYSVSGNMSYAKNKVTFFDESPNVADYQKKTGYPIDAYLLYQADGIYQTQAEIDATPHLPNTAPGDIKYLDINGDDKIDGKDMVRENLSPTPEIMYGINLGTKYINWELSILVQGQARAKTRLIPEGLYMDKVFFDGRWLKEGDNLYPRSFNSNRNAVGNNALPSTFWLKSAAFMRLKNVELAYNLPNSLTDRVNISNVRFFVNASNLFMIYDHIKIVDPETMQNGTTDIYPIQRLVNVGINVNF